MQALWQQVEKRLATLGVLESAGLLPGATDAQLDALEAKIGQALPASVRAFLMVHAGQQDMGSGIVLDQVWLTVEQIERWWRVWRRPGEAQANEYHRDLMSSDPPGMVKPWFSNPGWIPLTTDGGNNFIGLDFDPDVAGRKGQVITFGHDEDRKVVLAPDFERFMLRWVRWLEEEAMWRPDLGGLISLEDPAPWDLSK